MKDGSIAVWMWRNKFSYFFECYFFSLSASEVFLIMRVGRYWCSYMVSSSTSSNILEACFILYSTISMYIYTKWPYAPWQSYYISATYDCGCSQTYPKSAHGVSRYPNRGPPSKQLYYDTLFEHTHTHTLILALKIQSQAALTYSRVKNVGVQTC